MNRTDSLRIKSCRSANDDIVRAEHIFAGGRKKLCNLNGAIHRTLHALFCVSF